MTKEQKEFYETNGYLKIENALTQEELEKVREAARRAEEVWRRDPTRPGQRTEVLEQVLGPIEYDETLLKLLWHPVVFPIVKEILGNDVSMIDNDYFITPPRTPRTHANWHHDVGLAGVYHPLSTMMVKVFYLLSDVGPESGGTALIPGSHKFPMDYEYPKVEDPKDMPGGVQMMGKAGTAYLFNGRIYHAAVNNESDQPRRILIYNYGHFYMKIWQGYEPSERLKKWAKESGDPVILQLLGIGDPYGTYLQN